MNVYYRKRLIVVESNLEWAIPYWTKRKANDLNITRTII